MSYPLVSLTFLLAPLASQDFGHLHELMVHEQIEARGIRSPEILAAIRSVPRHLFVPPEIRATAYEDRPLLIGYGQSILATDHCGVDDRVAGAASQSPPAEDQNGFGVSGRGALAHSEASLYDRNHRGAANAAGVRLESLG